MKRTIIMLSAKRCGSTAIFHVFQKHPDVHVAHTDQTIALWESNFWNLAVLAIEGDSQLFIDRIAKVFPFLAMPRVFTEEVIFELWDSVLEQVGPIVFDKSPQYLGNRKALALLHRYQQRGNDVRLFAFIRDPRDAISSQYELWGGELPAALERRWLKKYSHLAELQAMFCHVPVFRYEDVVVAPICYIPIIFHHCGLRDLPESYDHLCPVHLNRYSASLNLQIRRWRMSADFCEHLRLYGYAVPQTNFMNRMLIQGKQAAWQLRVILSQCFKQIKRIFGIKRLVT